MKSIKKLLKNLEEFAGVGTTKNPHEAMYLLHEGTLIDGVFDYGSRTEDHRTIFCATPYNPHKNEDAWDLLHKDYRLVRLVPECGIALIRKRQRLTEIQKEIIQELGYEIEVY